MLPVSNLHLSLSSSPEHQIKKPKTPPDSSGKSSFNSLNSLLQPYLALHHPRAWLLLAILFLQILLLLAIRSVPFSLPHRRHHFRSPYTADPIPTAAVTMRIPTTATDFDQCGSGRVFVYDLPRSFNTELIENCDKLSPWGSRCEALSNDGFGREATGISSVVPENLAPAWFWTDQFVTEIIFHNRIMNHRCRTTEPESATAFYIPFYAGIAVDKYLWANSTAKERDNHCEMMLNWLQDQPYYKRSNGWDHFMTMGRITWDFRRSKEEDWGSGCLYKPGMRNITRLLIERNPWDYFDIGVPYPTGFHPRSESDVLQWQKFVRTRNRSKLFCFAGAPRGKIKNDFRGLLLSHCQNESDSCRVVNCSGTRCSNGTSAILETFLDSDFCLQPRGDSFTRRSIFDCMVAGSIPVLFWKRTAYFQYQWFLPGEPESYSVFIDRNAVKNGTSIRAVLEKYSREEIRRMREKVIEYIPKLVYAKPQEGLEGIKDAFDVAFDGVLKRVKEQEDWGFSKW
ncbi:xyloglucan galactosyltransferase KATAMARI1 [Tripterygium wilfordii]|uniref:Xyloglucan galactosyltransferase KATAMARI1 n=1 Tax=Tripterygium wilfordii TaxID=458696 RepID=A0A7J7DB51_TRIWF|nr:xyloglucan galactosyltransferase XLT2 [Tripterygium wilfordii]KAF5743582.1 xyloglucan galactosyltransferase KATAMARI1 [Tripterygium wilfordii]